jgi:hypothetical protein
VAAARGLPGRIQDELRKMLDGWYGEYESAAVMCVAEAALELLVKGGGPGSLRLTGTSDQVLIELTDRHETDSQACTSLSRMAPEVGSISTDHGYYFTLGEAASRNVRWLTVALPRVQSLTNLPVATVLNDVWS